MHVPSLDPPITHESRANGRFSGSKKLVMERLRTLDHIAYVRFASVYRDFADLESLRQEVETLAAGGGAGTTLNQLPLLPPETLGRGRRGRRPKSAAAR